MHWRLFIGYHAKGHTMLCVPLEYVCILFIYYYYYFFFFFFLGGGGHLLLYCDSYFLLNAKNSEKYVNVYIGGF